ncbi:pyruvate/2-oxoglutarate dehydrogenase complex dihydrolipoamide dehydrogenase [Antarcticibacterium sp. W02-3]|nr:mercuric reductase [Antarcticibacterium sp. W02-3]MCM4161130.1 pyruvate/2-oxoglutarate dehydrogenase complex dihydrolipoamide dehydrogenase [Antarcticibacterium sp. W02-3]
MEEFDAIIIGTGQAGPPLAANLAKNGFRTAIIEKSHLGGTCVNDGCTPTKAYVASARRIFAAGNSEEHGVVLEGELRVDLKKIKTRKDELVQESRSGLEKMFADTENITLIRGEATFIDEHTLQVGEKEYRAGKIYINVGGRPRIPDDFKEVEHLTNDSILELEEIPEHLIIVGGGYVGLEFGQMFRRFGSRVTILERGEQLLEKEDEDIAEEIAAIFKDSGIEVKLKSNCISAVRSGNAITVKYDCEENREDITGSHLLLATGRISNTEDLGLERAGVKLDDKGYIVVNEKLQTSVPHIWAMGDCNGEGAFTHTAYNDFQIVNSHLFEKRKRFLSDRFTCYAAFIDPPLARVGLNGNDIKEQGIKAKVAIMPMNKIARAKEKGETARKLKIFIENNTNKILGATFLGTGADEYIHTIIDQMYAGASYEIIRDAVHIHPTVSELLPTMLGDLKEF